ncbi:AAA family ATPase [Cystobacter fuscus]
MYINRLHVKNLKRMRDLSLDFTHEGKPRMWTVLVAENGACKTTLLQAIALVASGSDRANQLADVPSLPDLRRPAEEAVRLRADFEFGTRLEKWRVFPEASKVFFKEQRSRVYEVPGHRAPAVDLPGRLPVRLRQCARVLR